MQYASSREGANWKVEVDVREDPARRLLMRTINVHRRVGGVARHSVETHRLRPFEKDEIVNLLESMGFRVSVTHGYGSVELPSQRLGFIAQMQRRGRAAEF